MNTPHKWAKVIKALADGKVIEAKYVGNDYINSWVSYENYWVPTCNLSLFDNPDYIFRIKPDPKPDVLQYRGIAFHGMSPYKISWKFCIKPETKPDVVQYMGFNHFVNGSFLGTIEKISSSFTHILKITWNGETGEPSVEVIKNA